LRAKPAAGGFRVLDLRPRWLMTGKEVGDRLADVSSA
jgi:hypothetical protein